MKKVLTRGFLPLFFFLSLNVVAYAQNEGKEGMDSSDLFYNIYRSHSVEVTFPNDDGGLPWEGYTEPSGHILFPATITREGVNYEVERVAPWTFARCGGITGLTFAESLHNIGFSAFAFCEGLRSVEIPSSVQVIGGCAFMGCCGLQSAVLPEGMQQLSEYVFADCHALQSVVLPQSLKLIERSAFDRCALGEVTIPAGVIFIGPNAFRENKDLVTVRTLAVWPPHLEEGVFEGISSGAVLYVPQGCREAYSTADGWSLFSRIEEM